MYNSTGQKELLRLCSEVYERIRKSTTTLKNPQAFAARIIFEACHELLLIINAVPSTTAKATICRSMMECMADAHAIFRSKDRTSSSLIYISTALSDLDDSMHKLRDYINLPKSKRKGRPMRNLGKWNGKSLTQRLIDVDGGVSVIHLYDFLCYFAHVHPGRQKMLSVARHNQWISGYSAFICFAAIRYTLESGLYTKDEITKFDQLAPLVMFSP